MKRRIMVLALSVCFLMSLVATPIVAYANSAIDGYSAVEEQIDENTVRTVITKETVSRKDFDETGLKKQEDIILEYGLEKELLAEANSVTTQSQMSYYYDPSGTVVSSDNYNGSSRMTIITTVYDVTPNGDTYRRFIVQGFVNFYESFAIHVDDMLVINYSNNVWYDDSCAVEYGFSPYETVTPIYELGGVGFEVNIPSNLNGATLWGRYGIVANRGSVFNVQSTYIHSTSIFGMSVSISFYGVGVSVSGGNTQYTASPLTIYA